MLSTHPLAALVGNAVLLHHERPDGNGYPRRISGKQIPVIARIVAIGDAFDAMTSHRPYRGGMPRDQALAIIEELLEPDVDNALIVCTVHDAISELPIDELSKPNHCINFRRRSAARAPETTTLKAPASTNLCNDWVNAAGGTQRQSAEANSELERYRR